MSSEDDIPNEDDVYKMYSHIQQQHNNEVMRRNVESQDPNPFSGRSGREAFQSSSTRNQKPSFRSQFFNVGEGIKTIAAGDTVTLARLTVPAFHGGVLTGFSQDFINCDEEVVNGIKWGLRIDGLVPQHFQDFVGRYSSLSLPHSVYFVLAGGASTLGDTSLSPGSRPAIASEQDIPTVLFQATNNFSGSVILQGRLEGYMFPIGERDDEFGSI